MSKFFILMSLFLTLGCLDDTSRMMVDGELEPPVPDSSENDKTLGGVDSNNDGVRDDIERWINRKFPGEENYNKRMAWKQRARATRKALLAKKKPVIIERMHEWNNAGVCTYYIYAVLNREGLKEERKIGRELERLYLNNKNRTKKWTKVGLAIAGQAFTDPVYSKLPKSCDFKIQK